MPLQYVSSLAAPYVLTRRQIADSARVRFLASG